MPLPVQRGFFALIEEEPEVPDSEDAVTLRDVRGNVELSHVSFSYSPDKKLIEDFNLQVRPGQRIAIVGDDRMWKDHAH